MSKNVALVLSSGGARGLAQVGVIEELERFGFNITSIAGTSIGSLIGGLYATGKLQEFKKWIVDLDKLDIFRLVDFSVTASGFIRGERVFKEMESFFQDCPIEDLPIPYAAVAADIRNAKEVVFTHGSLLDAIKASVAIPAIFRPRIHEGKELVDGGVLNPIPIDWVRREDGDLLCVVNLNAKLSYKRPQVRSAKQKQNDSIYEKGIANFKKSWEKYFPPAQRKEPEHRYGYLELMMRSFDLVQDELCERILEYYQPDLLVEVSRQACDVFDFHRADEMIAEGRKALNRTLGWKLLTDPDFKI